MSWNSKIRSAEGDAGSCRPICQGIGCPAKAGAPGNETNTAKAKVRNLLIIVLKSAALSCKTGFQKPACFSKTPKLMDERIGYNKSGQYAELIPIKHIDNAFTDSHGTGKKERPFRRAEYFFPKRLALRFPVFAESRFLVR